MKRILITFDEWRKRRHLGNAEAAEIIGVTAAALNNAVAAGRIPRYWDKLATLAENPQIKLRFSTKGGSYGMPVAYFHGDARGYSPAEVIRRDGRIAGHVVLLWASMRFERTEEEYQLARRYLSQWPDGPQLR